MLVYVKYQIFPCLVVRKFVLVDFFKDLQSCESIKRLMGNPSFSCSLVEVHKWQDAPPVPSRVVSIEQTSRYFNVDPSSLCLNFVRFKDLFSELIVESIKNLTFP